MSILHDKICEKLLQLPKEKISWTILRRCNEHKHSYLWVPLLYHCGTRLLELFVR